MMKVREAKQSFDWKFQFKLRRIATALEKGMMMRWREDREEEG